MSYSWLPGLLREIAEITSLETALRIAEAKGGQRVNIPPDITERHWLAAVVGMEQARKIADHFATVNADGQRQGLREVIVPLGPAATIARARQKMMAEIANGVSPREAARRAGLHERTGWRVRRRLKAAQDDPQGTLF